MTVNEIQQSARTKMEKSLKALSDEFRSIRSGRASSSLVDRIVVSYYGSPTPIQQIASTMTPEPRLIVIQPFDRKALGEIEKAILASDLSLNPNNDGKVIRINVPPLTEERRKELVKVTKGIAEKCRVTVRHIRRDMNGLVKKGDFPEDDQKRAVDEIQKLTDRFIKEVDTTLAAKEKEILEI